MENILIMLYLIHYEIITSIAHLIENLIRWTTMTLSFLNQALSFIRFAEDYRRKKYDVFKKTNLCVKETSNENFIACLDGTFGNLFGFETCPISNLGNLFGFLSPLIFITKLICYIVQTKPNLFYCHIVAL